MLRFVFLIHILFFSVSVAAQTENLVYVDKQGILRYTQSNAEANFFGANYTTPFAYGYRSHKALGIKLEQAIDADVYHMSRLGLDAFRVHVWDVEISDSLGNVLNNEHLRLFDYLLMKLKQYHIKILITPIAFWGNGYPEKDIRTNGFSYVYTKGGAVVKEAAFRAQENYLQQFFKHVNPYTNLSYKDDPDVIAMEINNEPHHSGPKERTTEYINRMAAAVRRTGWTKPIFYNISESPSYAGAVVQSNVDGFSFQWYPTNLVANHEQIGNFLPHVDRYHIPFIDSLPLFKNKARMVYEFDAGDVMQPIMYPAMARSFRTAGFQWATQFAYDPMYTAHANTEYQTHYLNLAYTPSKAISLLIASKVFHQLPLYKSFGTYPSDTLFQEFTVSYVRQLSEMNTDTAFYYSNHTNTKPKNPSTLKHIAGVGSSSLIHYTGSGAYFLDKQADGSWRVEIMPDAIGIQDPFGKASVNRTVVKIEHKQHLLQLFLPALSASYMIKGINEGNNYQKAWNKSGNLLTPGVYHISRNGNADAIDPSYFAPRSQKDVSIKSLTSFHKKNNWFDPKSDKEKLIFYNPDWKRNTIQLSDSSLVCKVQNNMLGIQLFVGRIYKPYKKVIINVKATKATEMSFGCITTDGTAYTKQVLLQQGNNSIEIPFDQLKKDSSLLLPRPYPGFQPLWFSSESVNAFQLKNMDKWEIRYFIKNDASEIELYSIDLM